MFIFTSLFSFVVLVVSCISTLFVSKKGDFDLGPEFDPQNIDFRWSVALKLNRNGGSDFRTAEMKRSGTS